MSKAQAAAAAAWQHAVCVQIALHAAAYAGAAAMLGAMAATSTSVLVLRRSRAVGAEWPDAVHSHTHTKSRKSCSKRHVVPGGIEPPTS